jgi:hypothetical protein
VFLCHVIVLCIDVLQWCTFERLLSLCETDHSSPSSTEARIGGSVTPHPIRLHLMVFNKWSPGIICLINLNLSDNIHGPIIIRNDVSETELSHRPHIKSYWIFISVVSSPGYRRGMAELAWLVSSALEWMSCRKLSWFYSRCYPLYCL